MGLEVVVDGAKLKCTKAPGKSLTLKVSSNSTVMVENQKMATNLDISGIMPPPGPACTSKQHPVYLSVMASTGAPPPNPLPCIPKVVPWDPVSKGVGTSMMGLKALHVDSKCKCATTIFDGAISIDDPGTKKTTIN